MSHTREGGRPQEEPWLIQMLRMVRAEPAAGPEKIKGGQAPLVSPVKGKKLTLTDELMSGADRMSKKRPTKTTKGY
jgi:hypothetical protein